MRQATRTVWSVLLALALLLSLAPAVFAEEPDAEEPAQLEEGAALPEEASASEEEPAEPAASEDESGSEALPPAEESGSAAAEPEEEKKPAEEPKEEEEILDLDEEKLTETQYAVCLEIEEFLRDKMELNDAAIAAILANVHRESRFNPTLEGDKGTAFGLFQWHGIRQERLYEYCRKHRLDPMSVRGQMFFFRYEIQEYFGDLERHILRKCVDSEKGALWVMSYFCEGYEAPSDMEQNLKERSELTRLIYYPLVKGPSEELLDDLLLIVHREEENAESAEAEEETAEESAEEETAEAAEESPDAPEEEIVEPTEEPIEA